MNDDQNTAWFRPRRYGYGAGLPIAWQGWVALGLLLLVVIAPSFFLFLIPPPYRIVAMIGSLFIALCATGIFLALCRNHTYGGLRWRWGDRE
ncbi:hypothetical protein ABHV46_03455 [Asaia sp. BMEF1]|uniref:hypothetical protein n=1 Tax=unclassified Asaia TaxID=2685023 RepID=UPI0030193CF8